MPTQLYYTQTSCGAASFISAYAAGLIASGAVVPNETDIRAHKVIKGARAGADYYTINPKGNVPTLLLDDGTLLNENVATLLWIAAQAPQAKLAPAAGTPAWYVLVRQLAFLTSELHTSVGGQFNPALTAEQRALLTARTAIKLKYLDEVELAGGKKFLSGDSFTVADAYCYIILSWTGHLKIDLTPFPNVAAYLQHMGEHEAVKAGKAAMAAL
ncbi:hypothetical protein HK405_009261 [Cladochytrium tenue]|nr:hypothetical protein HK405_009261 [Cladochytrium tenue]